MTSPSFEKENLQGALFKKKKKAFYDRTQRHDLTCDMKFQDSHATQPRWMKSQLPVRRRRQPIETCALCTQVAWTRTHARAPALSPSPAWASIALMASQRRLRPRRTYGTNQVRLSCCSLEAASSRQLLETHTHTHAHTPKPVWVVLVVPVSETRLLHQEGPGPAVRGGGGGSGWEGGRMLLLYVVIM